MPHASAVDADSAALVTDLVTAALSREAKLDVLANADIRRQIELEADKAVMGCDEKASCLAELANAMGARFIVHGKIGLLEGEGDRGVYILTLNLFDSETAQAAGRVVARGQSLSALSDQVDGAVRDLTAGLVSTIAAGQRVRVLVLDIDSLSGVDVERQGSAVEEPAAPVRAMTWAGGGLAGAGLVAVGGAAALHWLALGKHAEASDRKVDALTAEELYGTRDALGAGALAAASFGVIAVLAGGALLAVSLMGE